MSDGVVARLAAERRRIEHRLTELRSDFADIVAASKNSNSDDEHDPEGATIACEYSQVQALIRQAERRLSEVAQAQVRLRDRQYRVYADCRVKP